MVILLVENDVGVQLFIWKLLRTDGFTVLTASDGEAALDLSRSYSGPLDLLITDCNMPRLNGIDLCKKITVERAGIKVLVMSGDLDWKEQASVNGWPFLQKPLNPRTLQDSITELIGSVSP